MNLLLDTHDFLWWIAGDAIPERAVSAIQNESNVVWLSAASAWEITIKASIGKLRFPALASQFIEQQRLLDRLLDLHLITADQAFASYDVKHFWA